MLRNTLTNARSGACTRARTLAAAVGATLMLALPAKADPQALDAFVASFDNADPAACEAAFADGATFVDLGRDLSERIGWFCGAVVDGDGRYTITDPMTEGDTTRFGFAYRAGGYTAQGAGELTGRDGMIEGLTLTGK